MPRQKQINELAAELPPWHRIGYQEARGEPDDLVHREKERRTVKLADQDGAPYSGRGGSVGHLAAVAALLRPAFCDRPSEPLAALRSRPCRVSSGYSVPLRNSSSERLQRLRNCGVSRMAFGACRNMRVPISSGGFRCRSALASSADPPLPASDALGCRSPRPATRDARPHDKAHH